MIDTITRKMSSYYRGDAGLTVTSDGEERLNGFLAGPISRKNVIAQPARDSYRHYGLRFTASF